MWMPRRATRLAFGFVLFIVGYMYAIHYILSTYDIPDKVVDVVSKNLFEDFLSNTSTQGPQAWPRLKSSTSSATTQPGPTSPPAPRDIHPGIHTYLPHLTGRLDLIEPAVYIGQGRSRVQLVIGIPSVRRSGAVYLYETIGSLLENMAEKDKRSTLLIIALNEPSDSAFVQGTIQELYKRFPQEMAVGTIEVIVPKSGFYPDLDSLELSLGDDLSRVKWRSKQNLDYAFLMMHSWTKGRYYMQLEDDVISTPDYVETIINKVRDLDGRGERWELIHFSPLGFIGKLFPSETIPKFLEFLLMFYADKPCDWLLTDFLHTKLCSYDFPPNKCKKTVKKASPEGTHLFQHNGEQSSLDGVVKDIMDNSFMHGSLEKRGSAVEKSFRAKRNFKGAQYNPEASQAVGNSPRLYGSYTKLYKQGMLVVVQAPKEGDILEIVYGSPVEVDRIKITTGLKVENEVYFKLLYGTIDILAVRDQSTSVTQAETFFDSNRKEMNFQADGLADDVLEYPIGLPLSPTVSAAAQEMQGGALTLARGWASMDYETEKFYTLCAFDVLTGAADCQVPSEFRHIEAFRVRVTSAHTDWVLYESIKVQAV